MVLMRRDALLWIPLLVIQDRPYSASDWLFFLVAYSISDWLALFSNCLHEASSFCFLCFIRFSFAGKHTDLFEPLSRSAALVWVTHSVSLGS